MRVDADLFAPGDRLLVEARRVWGEDALGSFACQVRRGDEVLLEGNAHRLPGPDAGVAA